MFVDLSTKSPLALITEASVCDNGAGRPNSVSDAPVAEHQTELKYNCATHVADVCLNIWIECSDSAFIIQVFHPGKNLYTIQYTTVRVRTFDINIDIGYKHRLCVSKI